MTKPLISPQTAREQLRQADERWRAAMRGHEHRAKRLKELADAAEQESRALRLAELANVPWHPIEGASQLQPPHELAKGPHRDGPPALWRRFDHAITQLGAALEGNSIRTLADTFEHLSTIVNELADTAEHQQQPTRKRQTS